MYIIIVGHKNGDVDYFGPFQTEGRAEEYAKEMPEDWRWHIKPIKVPYISRNVMG